MADPAGRLHTAAHLAMFCVGLYVTVFGPALPFLADDLDVSLGRAGLLLTALFLGSISASGAIAWRFRGFDPRAGAALGLGCVVAGLVIIALAPHFGVGLFGGLVLGLGDGFVVASTHSLAAVASDDVPRAMNRLNVYFALGAVLGPLWSGVVLSATGDREIVFGGLALFCVVPAILLLRPEITITTGAMPAAETSHRTMMTPLVWIMGGVLFLYVSAEIGLGSWVSTYSREAAGAGVVTSAVVTSAYWGALAMGRLGTGVLFQRGHDAGRVLLAAIVVAGVASLALALSGDSLAVGSAAAFATGLGLGPVWPLTVGIASANSGAGTPAAMVTMGNAGGLLFPWLQGEVLSSSGPSEGIALTSLVCAAMLALAVVGVRRQPT